MSKCAECERFDGDRGWDSYDRALWHVHTSAVGSSVHVEPVHGDLTLMYGGSFTRFAWRVPRLQRKWQRWCDRKNRAEQRARMIAEANR